MEKQEIKRVICAIVLLIILPAQAVKAVDEWPMFHHDLALSGYSASSAPDTDELLWVFDTESSAILSSPAIANGRLYIGSTDGNLYALDAQDGSLLWAYPTFGAVNSSPAVAEGKVYFLSEDGSVYALDADDGSLAWSVPIGNGSWDWASPAVHDGYVFVASSTGTMFALDADDGSTKWSTPIGGTPDSPITVTNGKVYSGTHNFDSSSSTMVALDEETGGILWTYDYHLYHGGVVGMVNSNGAAVVDGDNDGDLEVYFGVYNWGGVDDQAVCLDEATGTEVWTANINGNSTSTPAVHDGLVFIGSDDFNVYALEAGTGAYVWSFPTGDQVWAAPAVADGKVLVGSLDHTFYALDEKTGALVWSYFTGASRLIGSPAVAYGNVYVGNENGKIYAFGSLLSVDIDIKPTSCPNPLNVRNQGVLPVAILGSENFDIGMIDVSSIRLADVAPIRSSIEDVSIPSEGDECECTEEGPDGYLDLTLKFNTQDIVDALGEVVNGETLVLTLTGELSDGRALEGTDCVRILNKKKK